ncbi:MAG: hypothetical protein EBT42_04915, partial [Actinobacteria bacterium]|nr:hypothetical protein [Actinomycetota bacterium]
NVDFIKNTSKSVTFSEIDTWLTKLGFNLLNIEIDTRVAKRQGLFPLSTQSGSLIGGDAIWTRNPSEIYVSSSNEISVIYALFLYLNSLEDVALHFLVEASEQNNIDLTDTLSNSFINLLETKILSHLASALSAGWWDPKKITDAYRNLFSKDFPTKEELYLRLYP